MNSFIKKAFSLLLIGCFLVLGLGVVRVNAESIELEFDASLKTASTSSYNGVLEYGNWKIVNGANNNGGWSYFKLGGKSTTLSTCNPCYIYSTKATSNKVEYATVHLPEGSLPKNGMSVNSWGLYVFADSALENQIDYVAGDEITKSDQTVTFYPTENVEWPAGSYFKVSFDLANTSSTNGIVYIDNISLFNNLSSVKYSVTVENGIGSGQYESGTSATITAEVIEEKMFTYWSNNLNSEKLFKNSETVIVSSDITYTANYVDLLKSVDFATNSFDKAIETSTTNLTDYLRESENWIISNVAGSTAYITNKGYVKLGTGDSTGSITLNLKSGWTASGIKIKASKYGSDTGELLVNDESAISGSLSTDLSFIEFSFGESSEIVIKTSQKRAYIYTIELLNYSYEAPVTHSATIICGTGTGQYPNGEIVSISPNEPEGMIFTKWIKDDLVLSYDKDYSFAISSDCTIKAEFKSKDFFVDFTNDSNADTSEKVPVLSGYSQCSYIKSITGTNAYPDSMRGCKFGSGSANGSITITLKDGFTATGIRVKAKKYGSDSTNLTLNSGGEQTLDAETSIYEFILQEGANQLILASNDKKQRFYVYTIEILGVNTCSSVFIQGSVGLDAKDQGAFRLLGTVNEEFDSYGVAYKNSTGIWHELPGTPYESVYAYNGEEKVSYTAESLGANKIFGVEVTGLPKGVEYTVYTVSIKSFVEIDSVKYYSAERTFTVTVSDSGVAVVEA